MESVFRERAASSALKVAPDSDIRDAGRRIPTAPPREAWQLADDVAAHLLWGFAWIATSYKVRLVGTLRRLTFFRYHRLSGDYAVSSPVLPSPRFLNPKPLTLDLKP